MAGSSVDELRNAVESQHGGFATFNEAVPVKETFDDKTVWEGVVHVFDLENHPNATRCYAWSSPVDGSSKCRFYAVLEIPPVQSALDAVRAAIVAEHREGKANGD